MDKHTLTPSSEPKHPALIAGIPLETPKPWSLWFRFFFWILPVLWLGMGWIGYGWTHQAITWLDALAWSILIAWVCTVLGFIVLPRLQTTERLVIRNQSLWIDKRQKNIWSLPLEEPFSAILLHRSHREDALFILTHEKSDEACFLYGRYRNEKTLPPYTIATAPLHFSLAEEAMDHLGARMMLDRTIEYLPAIAESVAQSPGFGQDAIRLPLRPSDAHLVLAHQHVEWETPHTESTRMGYHALAVRAFRNPEASEHSFLVCLGPNTEATAPDHKLVFGTPFWVCVDWPRPLELRHLPEAPSSILPDSTLFTPVDAVILLHHLTQKEVAKVPYSLLLSKDTVPDREQ